MLQKAHRPQSPEDFTELKDFFAGGTLADPAVFLAAMGIAVKDDCKLFPIPLPPHPPGFRALGRRGSLSDLSC